MPDLSFADFGELLPQIDEVNEPFWRGLVEGEVRLQKCGACEALQYPPETFCYACGAREMSWLAVPAKGTVYSFIVVHQVYHKAFKPFVPYTVAIVQLDEGPRILAAMLELDKPIEIGARVRPAIRRIDDDRAFLAYVPEVG